MAMERVQHWNLALSAGAVVASFALVSPRFAAGVAVGAAIEALNYRQLLHSAKAFFGGRLRSWYMGFGLRFGLLAVALAVALYSGAHPVGLVVGLSLIIPAAIIEAFRTRPPIVPDAPALPPDDPSWDRWDPWLAREREDEDEEEDG